MIAQAIIYGADPNQNDPLKFGTYTWKNIEFASFVVKMAEADYSAANGQLYSSGFPDMSALPSISSVGGRIEWISHNHPENGASQNQRLEDRYPSVIIEDGVERGDWVALEKVKKAVAPDDPSYDPALWITASFGVTREFRLSERSIFHSLTKHQMQNAENLSGRTVNTQCGDGQ